MFAEIGQPAPDKLPPQEPADAVLEPRLPNEDRQPLPASLQLTDRFLQNTNWQTVNRLYEWYEHAMLLRDRLPLNQEKFEKHFFERGSKEPTFMYGDLERGYLLGVWKHEIFIPTHFAPKSLRGGYNLFKELANSKTIPVVAAVTADLALTLKKLKGWKALNIKLLAHLNKNLVDKTVVYNSYPGIRRKMAGLITEFLAETNKLKQK